MSDNELRVIDNHFWQPTVQTDFLKTPHDFPVALKRYTLCEIALTWHLYGGNDFPHPIDSVEPGSSKKEKRNTLVFEVPIKFYITELFITSIFI